MINLCSPEGRSEPGRRQLRAEERKMSASTQEPLTELETGPSQRVARLRERIVHAPREACIERARYLTESMSAHWEEHPHASKVGFPPGCCNTAA